ncbi:hypothetical protein, partial [Salmonella sp. s51228]|uniref:hypothetical protein n=1 Tax=Salmonella sp. s51228 TaxID=3159652 RepID=UPI003980310F
KSGIDKREQGKNPETVISVLKFYNSQPKPSGMDTPKYMSTSQNAPLSESVSEPSPPEIPPRPISTRKTNQPPQPQLPLVPQYSSAHKLPTPTKPPEIPAKMG